MPRRTDDDMDDRVQNADERAAKRVRERAGQEEHARVSDDVTRIRIDKDDDEDEEIEEQVSRRPTDTPADQQARTERRRNRYREQVQARERSDAEAKSLREENDRLRMQSTAYETMRQFMPQQRPTPQADPLDREIDVTERELATVQSEFRRLHTERQAEGKPLSMAEIDEWNDKARKLDREVTGLRIRKEARGQAPAPQGQGNMTVVAQEAVLRMQYPDVMNDDLMRATAVVRAQRIMRDRGLRSADLEVVRQAIEETREEFGIGNGAAPARQQTHRPARSPGFLAKFGGAASGSSGQGGERSSRGEVVMGKAEKRMARAMYPSLPEDKAYATWAKKVGAKVQSG